MGYRTVVMLDNDVAHKWQHDPSLGRLIAQAASNYSFDRDKSRIGRYGRVVECLSYEVKTLALLEGCVALTPLARMYSQRQEIDVNKVAIDILTLAAERLGYKLVKK